MQENNKFEKRPVKTVKRSCQTCSVGAMWLAAVSMSLRRATVTLQVTGAKSYLLEASRYTRQGWEPLREESAYTCRARSRPVPETRPWHPSRTDWLGGPLAPPSGPEPGAGAHAPPHPNHPIQGLISPILNWSVKVKARKLVYK